jgi:hypothetical protein
VADLVILSLVVAGVFSGFVFLGYDWYSTLAWRRQFAPQAQPVPPQPQSEPATADLRSDALPLETVKVAAR